MIMHNRLLYITIETGENIQKVLINIKNKAGHLKFTAWNKPVELTGNFKILELRDRSDRLVKIDGPGFIIDQLYEYFL